MFRFLPSHVTLLSLFSSLLFCFALSSSSTLPSPPFSVPLSQSVFLLPTSFWFSPSCLKARMRRQSKRRRRWESERRYQVLSDLVRKEARFSSSIIGKKYVQNNTRTRSFFLQILQNNAQPSFDLPYRNEKVGSLGPVRNILPAVDNVDVYVSIYCLCLDIHQHHRYIWICALIQTSNPFCYHPGTSGSVLSRLSALAQIRMLCFCMPLGSAGSILSLIVPPFSHSPIPMFWAHHRFLQSIASFVIVP